MKARLILVALGAIIAIAGIYITSNPIFIPGGTNNCTIENGCSASSSATIPSLGLGAIVFVLGFILAVYGYRRDRSDED